MRTSAARDAVNGQDFLKAIEQAAGIPPIILSGEEEARLSFFGASRAVKDECFCGVIDIGGGSTEIVTGCGDNIECAFSCQMGAVRLFREIPIARKEDMVPVMETALKILEAHPELPETLQARALFMRNRLAEKNIRIRESNGERIPIIPIYTYELEPTLIVTKDLYDRGVYVNSSIPPAVAPGECLLRTSLMATHTEALIEEAVDIIAEVLNIHHIGE